MKPMPIHPRLEVEGKPYPSEPVSTSVVRAQMDQRLRLIRLLAAADAEMDATDRLEIINELSKAWETGA